MKVTDLSDLEHLGKKGENSLYPDHPVVKVALASCGKAAGADKTFKILKDELEDTDYDVKSIGCIGICQKEPLFQLHVPGYPILIYTEADKERTKSIVDDLKTGIIPIDDAFCKITADDDPEDEFENVPEWTDVPFFKKQRRVVMKNAGFIDPENIEEYIARGGYRSLYKVVKNEIEDVIDDIKDSNLRGRGGAGFPTGVKWELTKEAEGDKKYIIGNADEGDPGAYMDRNLLESDPHSVLEGMIIGAYTIEADKGFIYIRSEYPLALKRVRKAIDQARDLGLLGENIFDSGFDFDIEIFKSAGAFVCGEETALMHAIESDISEPRPRPPFPAESGLWGKPTNINNVETWANVPHIIENGAGWFADIGTDESGGTKVFSLTGDIDTTGLIEVPIGISLEEIIHDIGGGISDGRFKAVQTGGPSGGVIPEEHIDKPVDYETLTELGSMMGSGGMVVMSTNTCMINTAQYFIDFTLSESCGKCTPCREGLKNVIETLDDISKGKEVDLDFLKEVASVIKEASLCGLGKTAPNPLLTTLDYFEEEYREHMEEQKCRARVCKELIEYRITDDCIKCGNCLEACPEDAIMEGEEKYSIDLEKCIRCGTCLDVCPVDAIEVI